MAHLSPGTFTETLERGPDPVIGEALYRYNAELALPFNQAPDTVYWLKIAALVDVPQPIVVPIPPGTTQWGWHNRDYTINNPQASTAPAVNPGEFIDGTVAGTDIPSGTSRMTRSRAFWITHLLRQTVRSSSNSKWRRQNYVFVNSAGQGPIDGPPGIELKSKDLAFRLYTNPIIPEPASGVLLAIGLAGVLASHRRSRRA